MTGLTLTTLEDFDHGTSVICAGHVPALDFARRIDCDDVAILVPDYAADEKGYP